MSAIENFRKALLVDFPLKRDDIIAREALRRFEGKGIGKAKSLIGLDDHDTEIYNLVKNIFRNKLTDAYESLVWELLTEHQADGRISDVKRGGNSNDLTPMRLTSENIFCTFHDNKSNKTIALILRNTPRSLNASQYHSIESECSMINVFRGECYLVYFCYYTEALYSRSKVRGLEPICFEDFLQKFFNNKVVDSFRLALNEINDNLDELIGYSVTEICSRKTLKRFKGELTEEWKTLDYIQYFNGIKVPHETAVKLRDKFLSENRYKTLFDGSDYSDSYITSEWFFKKYAPKIKASNFDMTSVVAGYFKSVEQLLDAFIRRCGRDRVFQTKNYEIILVGGTNYKSMLGDMQKFLYNNIDLFEESNASLQVFYLKKLKDWIANCRNGYLHKDNIQDPKTLKKIREETISLYFYTLTMYNFNRNN